jgi:hypothetical protein
MNLCLSVVDGGGVDVSVAGVDSPAYCLLHLIAFALHAVTLPNKVTNESK